jgi:chromosome partitioning protein
VTSTEQNPGEHESAAAVDPSVGDLDTDITTSVVTGDTDAPGADVGHPHPSSGPPAGSLADAPAGPGRVIGSADGDPAGDSASDGEPALAAGHPGLAGDTAPVGGRATDDLDALPDGTTDSASLPGEMPPPSPTDVSTSESPDAGDDRPLPAAPTERESVRISARSFANRSTSGGRDVSRETEAVSQQSGGHVSRETAEHRTMRPVDRPSLNAYSRADTDDDGEDLLSSPVDSATFSMDDTPIGRAAQHAVEVRQGELTLPRPRKRRVFTVANQKGGVGKTTTTVNIGVALALAGLHVLVIDLDPQGNTSTALGAERKLGTPSIYEVLLGEIEAAEAIQTSPEAPRLGVLPATIDLAGAEIELVTMVARESRLKGAIDAIKGEYDYVFIDCPPSLGLLTVNAMVATEEVLIPIQCEYYALEGLGQLLSNIALVQQHLNPGLEVSTILLTMYDGRTKLADQVANEVRKHFEDKVLRTVIPRSVKVSEAPGFGQSVMTYDPGSRGAMSYLDAAREIAERGARPIQHVDPLPSDVHGPQESSDSQVHQGQKERA